MKALGLGESKFGKIWYYSSVLLVIEGLALLLPGLVAYVIDSDFNLSMIFFGVGAFSLIVGFLSIFLLGRPTRLGYDEALSIAAFGWLLMTFVGSLPFSLSGKLPALDAFFESMSGFTATGLTMFGDRVESLPYSILFWRTFTQWIGGVGVIVLFLSILIRSSGIAAKLYKAEGRTDRISTNIVSTARRIWGIYILYTVLCIIGLTILLGGRVFDAINIGMTSLATGGFSVTNDSIATYDWPVAVFIIPFMLLGGISFASHRFLLKGRFKEFFTIEVKAIMLIIFISSIFLMTRHSGLDSTFQTTSALTGTGFSTAKIAAWDDFSKFMMSILMVMGGGYGSTSSALKMFRVVIIIYAVAWVVKKFLYSRKAVIPFKLGKNTYPVEEIRTATLYAILYIIVLCIGALIFMAGGHSAADSLFEVASAEGNVGLSVGITNSSMHAYEKVVLIIEMWVGRLEIFPVLTLLAVPFRKR